MVVYGFGDGLMVGSFAMVERGRGDVERRWRWWSGYSIRGSFRCLAFTFAKRMIVLSRFRHHEGWRGWICADGGYVERWWVGLILIGSGLFVSEKRGGERREIHL